MCSLNITLSMSINEHGQDGSGDDKSAMALGSLHTKCVLQKLLLTQELLWATTRAPLSLESNNRYKFFFFFWQKLKDRI